MGWLGSPSDDGYKQCSASIETDSLDILVGTIIDHISVHYQVDYFNKPQYINSLELVVT